MGISKKTPSQKRVTRYAKVSASMANFGARAVGKRYSGASTRIGRGKPAFARRAWWPQRAIDEGGANPFHHSRRRAEEYAMELSQLQADAPSMDGRL